MIHTQGGRQGARLARFVLCGVVLGLAGSCSPGAVLVLGLVAVTGLWLFVRGAPAERRFILGLFVVGFLLRAAVSVGLDAAAQWAAGPQPFRLVRDESLQATVAVDRSRGFIGAGDSDYYSIRSYDLARYVRGDRDPRAVEAQYLYYGSHSYLYVIGWFYYLFGFSPVAVKLLTCYWGALIGPVLYGLAKTCFPVPAARWAALAVTFVPSLVFWSATNLKDTPLILLGVLLVWALIRLWLHPRLATHPLYLVVVAVAFWTHATMRSAAYSLLLLPSFCLAAWWAKRISWVWRGLTALIIMAGVIMARSFLEHGIAEALDRHVGNALSGGAAYHFLPAQFYEASGRSAPFPGLGLPLGAAFSAAVAHYLLQPFPWQVHSVLQSLVCPQMMLWYVSLGLALSAMVITVRERQFERLFVMAVMMAWTAIGALTNGNAGTVFRMRDMVTPLFVMFAAYGLWKWLAPQRRMPSQP